MIEKYEFGLVLVDSKEYRREVIIYPEGGLPLELQVLAASGFGMSR